MPKSAIDRMDQKMQRALSAGAFENGRHVWWQGPQEAVKSRDVSAVSAKGPDPYDMCDRDGIIRKCLDHRWRACDAQDTTQKMKFGPNARDKDLNPNMRPAMAAHMPRMGSDKESRPTSWKTNPDPYGINWNDNLQNRLKADKSRLMIFPRVTMRETRKGRFSTPTLFGKDYTILAGR
jgi:hypothetical protein